MKTRNDHELHVALELLYMALDKYDDPHRRFFEASAVLCEQVATQCAILAPDESPVRMAMLAYQVCLSSPLMDIVQSQDAR